MLNAAALAVEFVLFAAFAFSSYVLYHALANQPPLPADERQLDNDFVPYLLLFLLAAGALIFGLGFLIHFASWRIMKKKENSRAANHLA